MKITRKGGERAAITATVKALGNAEGKVGWFESARYEGGQPVAGVAFVQEHGSPKHSIPARPFMRPTAAEKSESWAKTAAGLSRAAMRGEIAPDAVMEGLALAAEGNVRVAITKLTAPALSPKTVAARKRRLANKGKGAKASIAKPLVDTGLMLATLTSQVTKK